MTKESVSIFWFRQDLRLADNPALTAAIQNKHVIPIYILDDENAGDYKMGAASRVWLHHGLKSLDESLNGHLSLYKGCAKSVFEDLMDRYDIQNVYWNRCYEPWRIKRDGFIKDMLKDADIHVESHNGSLLWEPWTIKNGSDEHYKVFTPFYKKGCLNAESPREPLDAPKNIFYKTDDASCALDDLDLLPKISWDASILDFWNIGEDGAHERFQEFLDEGLDHYKDGRNLPSKPFVSRMSPYLHFGHVSPNQLWYTVRNIGGDKHIEHFCSELGWREFSYSQLFHNPDLPTVNLQSKFDDFPWNDNDDDLKAWQRGKTGVPMVDAGMRQLWATGYMHNRVRMIVGSFLVKNLRLHWHHGERWFWDTLVDADLSSNSASWQWIAGCGADAAPYFRIFNPVTQGQKFDEDGDYIREWIPELKNMPNKYLFNPWEAPEDILKKAGVKMGDTYPNPVVDLKTSREKALEAFKSLKKEEN